MGSQFAHCLILVNRVAIEVSLFKGAQWTPIVDGVIVPRADANWVCAVQPTEARYGEPVPKQPSALYNLYYYLMPPLLRFGDVPFNCVSLTQHSLWQLGLDLPREARTPDELFFLLKGYIH